MKTLYKASALLTPGQDHSSFFLCCQPQGKRDFPMELAWGPSDTTFLRRQNNVLSPTTKKNQRMSSTLQMWTCSRLDCKSRKRTYPQESPNFVWKVHCNHYSRLKLYPCLNRIARVWHKVEIQQALGTW